jgi:hypothetical protein
MGVQFQVTVAVLTGPLKVTVVVIQMEKTIVTAALPPDGMVPVPGWIVTPLWLATADQESEAPAGVLIRVTVQIVFPFWSVVQAGLTGFGLAVINGLTVRVTVTATVFAPSLTVTVPV